MKEFVFYTALRIGLFAATLALVAGAWLAIDGSAPWFWLVVIAFVISGVGSLFLLNRPRQAFAMRVEERADRAVDAFEQRRSREDAD